METINLDNRLLTIASFCKDATKVADIGTDHGLIPIYLILNDKAKEVLACDIAIKPLEKAKENVLKYHLEDKISFHLTNGLSNLPHDIDVIIIAGMGGHLIASILKDNDYKYDTLILQANKNSDVLRKTLVDLNYQIVAEEISFSKNKFYEIIVAKKVPSKILLDTNEIKYGPINLKFKKENFVKMLNFKLKTLNNILANNSLDKNKEKEILDEINTIKEITKKER